MRSVFPAKLGFLVFLAAAPGVPAQNAAPPPLVRLYPVATDAHGQPVADLTGGDFEIADQGKSQSVFFFRRPAEPSPPLAAQEYSNRPNGTMPQATAILFDLMNESDSNRVDAWHTLAKSIPQMDPRDAPFFYLLNLSGELVPVRGIASEPAAEAPRLQTFQADLDKAVEAANRARPTGIDREDRTKRTYHELEVLANQLATLAGRRNIVWITSHMPSITNSAPCSGDWVDCGLYVAHTAVTLERDGVAVYPASLSGVIDPDAGYDLEQIALLTGGRTIFGRPVREVLQQAAGDSANLYDLFYAPEASSWDNKFHRIRVTCKRNGVKLQVKERYYALADSRSGQQRQEEELQAAYYRPADTSGIGLRVKVSPAANGIHLEIRVDVADLLLREQAGKYSGIVAVLISDRGAKEQSETGLMYRPLGEPAESDLRVNLTKEERDSQMGSGLLISQDHAINAGVARVRVMVMDRNTNQVGSVTFPVR